MAENQRDFKGVWIPKAVWLDSRLTALDKVILTEIDSLDQGERGCYASNAHIAEFCQCSEAKVTKSISQLTKLGYVYVQKFDGRQRELRSRLVNFTRQNSEKYDAESEKVRQSNTYNNTSTNTSKKKERKTGYDQILSQIEDDSLRELYLEYIKMRKMIKSPMTDRALTMLIKKVNDLESSPDRQKLLLETAIMNNWKSVYPLKENQKYGRKEPVPGWMGKFEMGDDEKEAIRRILNGDTERQLFGEVEEEVNIGNSPELAERAARLREELQGG